MNVLAKNIVSTTPQFLNPKVLLLFFATSVIVGALLSVVISELVNPMPYEQGKVAPYTIRAPRDVLIEDVLNTEDRRTQAAKAVRRVFSIDDSVIQDTNAQLNAVFSYVQSLTEPEVEVKLEPGKSESKFELTPAQKREFEIQYNVDLVGSEWSELADSDNWLPMADAVRTIVEPILRKGVISNKVELTRSLRDGSVVMRSTTGGVEREITKSDDVYSLKEALSVVDTASPSVLAKKDASCRSLVRKLATSLIHPNAMFDASETERRVAEARSRVDPIYYRIRRGEVIVRQGDVISLSQEQRLKQLRDEVGSGDVVRNCIGYIILCFIILTTCYGFLATLWPNHRKTLSDLVLICVTIVGSLLLLKVFSLISTALGETFSYFDSESILLSAPLSGGGILLQVTVGASGVLLFVLSFALLTGMFLQNSWLILVLVVVGNCVGALAVRHCSRRSSFIAAGVRVGMLNVAVVSCFLLLYGEAGVIDNVNKILWALFGGLMSGILGGGVTPIAEFFGGYITDIKLLELASLDRPLLRDLSLQAPGSWNHSMVIGQMGESAAEAIGANGLLTRVGAYYHDIGKMKKPAYFVENQTEKNPHDKLTPSMSALIIKSHVKDGLELAKEHRLPKAIVDFIPQHHGTALISYFYTKALKDAEQGENVEESHYRYGGPKPQSKEAGILMLADVVEASSRTLSDPTPAKIQGLVQKSINRVFTTGELEECDLSLQDLHKIAKTFIRVLNGIYHRRVQYSEAAEKTHENRTNTGEHPTVEVSRAKEDTGSKAVGSKSTAKPGGNKNGNRDNAEGASSRGATEGSSTEEDGDDSKEALKRLGMQ